MGEDRMFTHNGKIKYPLYMLKLINSSNSEIDELSIDDIKKIVPVIDKYGNASIMISYYDVEYCINSTLFCDEFEIEKSELII